MTTYEQIAAQATEALARGEADHKALSLDVEEQRARVATGEEKLAHANAALEATHPDDEAFEPAVRAVTAADATARALRKQLVALDGELAAVAQRLPGLRQAAEYSATAITDAELAAQARALDAVCVEQLRPLVEQIATYCAAVKAAEHLPRPLQVLPGHLTGHHGAPRSRWFSGHLGPGESAFWETLRLRWHELVTEPALQAAAEAKAAAEQAAFRAEMRKQAEANAALVAAEQQPAEVAA